MEQVILASALIISALSLLYVGSKKPEPVKIKVERKRH